MPHVHAIIPSPIGALTLLANDRGLAALLWENDDPARVKLEHGRKDDRHPVLREAARQLDAYFAGRLRAFDLPLDFTGTAFQKAVWAALLTIPFGQTRSYGQIARQIGKPKAVRAVGAACGANPLAVVIPCHRVVRTDGTLSGYRWGVERKRTLLAREAGQRESGA